MRKKRLVRKKRVFRNQVDDEKTAAVELVQSSTRPNERNSHKKGLSTVQHGAHSLRRRYYAGLIDRRSKIGMWLSELEKDFCRHLNYLSIDAMPVTMRMMVVSSIGNWLLLALHDAGHENSFQDLRAAENLVMRNVRELGVQPTSPPGPKLKDYLEAEGFEVKE